MSDVDAVRGRFADALAARLALRSARLREAFARVPRERFLGRGPWLLFAPEGYTSTPDADPAHLYADVSVAIDAPRLINNGSPDLGARMLDALDVAPGERAIHVGCGSGYYTAILAELVGPSGAVLALEIDPRLAERAAESLRAWSCVQVECADGVRLAAAPADAILVSGGASHPHAAWLEALRPGGRLVVPLTAIRPPRMSARVVRDHAGLVLRAQRVGEEGWSAAFVERVAIPALVGGRDSAVQRRLADALRRGDARRVRSLVRRGDEPETSCWLRGDDFCLSTREPPSAEPAR